MLLVLRLEVLWISSTLNVLCLNTKNTYKSQKYSQKLYKIYIIKVLLMTPEPSDPLDITIYTSKSSLTYRKKC